MNTKMIWQGWRCLWSASVILALPGTAARGQGTSGTVVYGSFPATPDPKYWSWDSQGYRLWAYDIPQTYELTIQGQAVLTFSAGPEGFLAYSSSQSGLIAVHNGPLDFGTLAVPLSRGQEIGSNALGYGWDIGDEYGSLFHQSLASGVEGVPFLTLGYFSGVESAYAGFCFELDNRTYYGWIRVGAPLPGISSGWLYDYAYQTTPDTPILAGQVPEPSVMALLSLGLLVCALKGSAFLGR